MGCLDEVVALIIASGARRIAVTGPDGAGKTRFADDLTMFLVHERQHVLLAHVDDFHNPRTVRYARGRDSAEGFYRDTTNLAGLRTALLDPIAPGGNRMVKTRIFDHKRDECVDTPAIAIPEGARVILEGIFLIRPELSDCFDMTIYLDVPFAETFRRMALRDGSDPDPNSPASSRYRGGQEIWMAEVQPRKIADIVIDNSNFAAPKLVARRGNAC